jgi:hypothetical protein
MKGDEIIVRGGVDKYAHKCINPKIRPDSLLLSSNALGAKLKSASTLTKFAQFLFCKLSEGKKKKTK